MATETLYVNKPGGVVVHLQDGRSKGLAYGDPVPGFGAPGEDTLADYQDPTKFADPTPRRVGDDDAMLRAAHERAAFAENGQVHAGSSPIPSNYANLDEDAAAQFVRNLERYPEAQAKVLIHERLYAGGRQKVQDAATDGARISAEVQLAELATPATAVGSTAPGFTGYGDPDKHPGGTDATAGIVAAADLAAQSLRTPAPTSSTDETTEAPPASEPTPPAPSPSPSTTPPAPAETPPSTAPDAGEAPADYSGFSYNQLKGYIDQHGLDVAKNQSGEKLVEGITAVEGHDKPQTPPQPEKS